MGVGARDIFGGDVAQQATSGSYGLRASRFRLPAATRLGEVKLEVGNLERSLKYYGDVLGLQVVERSAQRASLASQGDDRVLVELTERTDVRPARRAGRLGLYHFAILLPDRAALGRFAQHLADHGVYAGSADHLVSEAFYLTDPDGLGIEVYADRPRDTWRRVDRELMMATDPLDVAGLVRAAGAEKWSGMPAGTMMGHVHLHVGDVAQAAAFYSDALGFDRMVWSYPGALFMAAGGYHHHLGTNTWAGADATPSRHDEAQLLEWTIEVPSASDVADVRRSMMSAKVPVDDVADGITMRDPWGTMVRVCAASRGAG